MRFQKLDMNLLVALDTLLTDPHITRAAERLRVSQPAMSGSLARLREHFRDELVIQVGRRMELTPLARDLREPVHDLLTRADRVLSTRASFDPLASDRRFTVHCTDYVWATLIQEVVARLINEAPLVRIDYSGNTRDFIERRVELMIVADRFAIAGLPAQTLFKDPMVCVAWAENEAVGAAVSAAQYFDLLHVAAYTTRPTLMDDWISRNCDQRCKIATLVPNYSLVPQAVVGTPFLATVPLRMAVKYSAHLPLRIIPPPLDFPSLVEVLQWHPHQSSDSGLQWLRDVLVESASRLEPPML